MKEKSKFICVLPLRGLHAQVFTSLDPSNVYLHWLRCHCTLDYHSIYLHVLIASGTKFTENLTARVGKRRLMLGLVASERYLTVYSSFYVQVKQVYNAQTLVSKPGPWFFPILKQIWHDAWLNVMLPPLHPLPLKNKLKVWDLLSNMITWVKAFTQLSVSPRLHKFSQ